MTTLIPAAAVLELIDSITFDESGVLGQGGNGGLLSRKTIDLANRLRQQIEKPDMAGMSQFGKAILSSDEQKSQGKRCRCGGFDDYCVCQNLPDKITIAARKEIEKPDPAEADASQPKHEAQP